MALCYGYIYIDTTQCKLPRATTLSASRVFVLVNGRKNTTRRTTEGPGTSIDQHAL